jgi:hypothetical protein
MRKLIYFIKVSKHYQLISLSLFTLISMSTVILCIYLNADIKLINGLIALTFGGAAYIMLVTNRSSCKFSYDPVLRKLTIKVQIKKFKHEDSVIIEDKEDIQTIRKIKKTMILQSWDKYQLYKTEKSIINKIENC